MRDVNLFEPLESMFETAGFDEQSRSRFSMEAFFSREIESAPRHLYDYWNALPVETGAEMPLERLCRPIEALPAKMSEWVSWIDTTAQDPMCYTIWNHRDSHIPGMGPEISGKKLGDIKAAPLHISACAIEFLYCKHERIPMYYEIDQIICGFKRHYTRIMVPVSDGNGAVNRIVYAIRLIGETVRVDTVAGRLV